MKYRTYSTILALAGALLSPFCFGQSDADPLTQSLTSTSWSWDNIGGKGFKIRLLAGGVVTCSNGQSWHWVVSGPRSVHCIWRSEKEFMDVTFDDALTKLDATGVYGQPLVTGKRLGNLSRPAPPIDRTATPPMKPGDDAPKTGEPASTSTPTEDFEKALFSHTWTWSAAGAKNDPNLDFTFTADGVVTSSTGLKLRWKRTGPRMLNLEAQDGRTAALSFDAMFLSFETQGFDGKMRISGAQNRPVTVSLPVASPPLPPSQPAEKVVGGIAIAGIKSDQTSVLMATGGHSQEIQDLTTLLSAYGTPSVDIGPHPEAEIYPGIPYLMPWHDAEKILVPRNSPTRSGDKIACAGFPDGLNWICYDGSWDYKQHSYNHLYILKDIINQVVCIEFRQEHGAWGLGEGFQVKPGNWHLIDYINAEVKGQASIRIDTLVLDQRSDLHRIVVHTTNQKINHTATMFLPEPLINLIFDLYAKTGRAIGRIEYFHAEARPSLCHD